MGERHAKGGGAGIDITPYWREGGREVLQTIAPVSAFRRFLTITKRRGERQKSINGITSAVRLAPLRASLRDSY